MNASLPSRTAVYKARVRPERVLPGGDRAPVPGDNAEIVTRGYDAWNRGDIAAVLELVDPHFEWHESSEVPGGAHVYTREQFGSYLASLSRLWKSFRFEPQELLAAGDEVLVDVLEVARGRASGVEVTQRFVHVWTVRDGRACRMRAYRDKAEALRAVGLEPD